MPTRRPKGEGSVIKLPNGNIRVRIEIEPVDGKRRWLSATAKTKKEAVAKLKELQRQKEDNILQIKANEDTIAFLLEKYMLHLKASNRAGSTIRQIKLVINQFDKHINSKKVSSITKGDADSMLLEWRQKGLKDSSVSTMANKLKCFFDWCVSSDLITIKNPFTLYYTKVKKKKSKHGLVVLSLEEHETIKSYLLEFWSRKSKPVKRWSLKFRMYALYCLAYETGMRDGEIAALTWKDINLEDNTVSVNGTVKSQEDSSKTIGDPKTGAGFRTIKISKKTCDLLAELKEFSGDVSEYVFYNHKTHTYYWAEAIQYVWREILEAVGITRHLTFHDIRHTNASNMIYKNVPIAVITERLGHSDISITYQTYGHIIQECKERNMAVIEA